MSITSARCFSSATGLHRGEKQLHIRIFAWHISGQEVQNNHNTIRNSLEFLQRCLGECSEPDEWSWKIFNTRRRFHGSEGKTFHFPGALVQQSRNFFSDTFILSHFMFAFDLLKKINCLNDALQEQYTVCLSCGKTKNRMKRTFCECLQQMKNESFGSYDYISNHCDREKKSFLNIIERLILNMDIRFPCPSSSIELRQARQYTNYSTNTLEPTFFRSVRMNWPLILTVGLFIFPTTSSSTEISTSFSCVDKSPKSTDWQLILSTIKRLSLTRSLQTPMKERWSKATGTQ